MNSLNAAAKKSRRVVSGKVNSSQFRSNLVVYLAEETIVPNATLLWPVNLREMYNHILLPTDGSEETEPAIEQAIDLTNRYDASL